MLNIVSHLGNVNQTIEDITTYSLGCLQSKRQTITSVGKDVEKLEHLNTVMGI